MDEITVALYMRLSREDDDMKDESNSISNQRKLLLGFLKRNRNLRTALPSSMWMTVIQEPVLKGRALQR